MTLTLTAEMVRADFEAGLTVDDMCQKYGCSWNAVMKRRREAGLTGHRQKPKPRSTERRLSRFSHKPTENSHIMALAADHPAVTGARTLFPGRVSNHHRQVLISGMNQAKIGAVVMKGRWKNYPVFAVTLQERATCPTTCRHWRDCYGNRMSFSLRWAPGQEFEDRLWTELNAKQAQHPEGFAVRLHVLGDFYSTAYVNLWRRALREFPALVVFGFTARWDDEIGLALRRLAAQSRRFAIRFSDAPTDTMATISLSRGEFARRGSITCPQQTGKTVTCGTCALCWQTTKTIAFIQH